MHIENIAKRLQEEALKNYSSTRVKDPVYNEALHNLFCIQKAFTNGPGKHTAVIPLHLVQAICTLSIIAFDDAGDFHKYKEGIPSALDKIWLLFTTTLIHYVRQQKTITESTLLFGCFEIPMWFIKESKSLEPFKYFD